MGRYQSIYCGPYARFQYPHKTRLEEVTECTGCKISSRRYGEGPHFCGNCGTAFVRVPKEVDDVPNVYETLQEREELHELYLDTDNRILCVGPNIRGFGRHIGTDESPTSITDFNISEEMKRFSIRFQKDLDILAAEYGEPEILWGVHAWTS